MSIVKIYSVRNSDHVDCGQPEDYTLDASIYSSLWYYIYDSADYLLPEGYRAAKSNFGTKEIYNAKGEHCPLVDGDYFGREMGTPHIMDIYAANPFIALEKVEAR
ncbi:MAG: hypothetical protein RR235_09865 [Oscillospiraceae bacterium]